MTKRLGVAVGLFCAFFSSNAYCSSDDFEAPSRLDGATVIDAEKLIELKNGNDDLVIIDSRIETDRSSGYIPSSVGLTDDQTRCDSLAGVLSTPTTPVVFYCNGVKCNRSTRAISTAKQCGYSEIYWFRGGMHEWKGKGYPVTRQTIGTP